MSEDTSSSPRQEWYEADYEPDEPPELQGRNLRIGPLSTALEQLTRPRVGEVAVDRSGRPLGIIMSIDPANQTAQVAVSGTLVRRPQRVGKHDFGVHIHAMTQAYTDGLKKFADAITVAFTKSDFAESNPGPEESPRDRALRLAKQPHSMAQDPSAFHFDARGRRRY